MQISGVSIRLDEEWKNLHPQEQQLCCYTHKKHEADREVKHGSRENIERVTNYCNYHITYFHIYIHFCIHDITLTNTRLFKTTITLNADPFFKYLNLRAFLFVFIRLCALLYIFYKLKFELFRALKATEIT